MHIATLPGMWDRTVTISSAGKTFSVTGWQVGWVLGPRSVIQEIQIALPYMQFCAATPMQEGMARAIEKADEPYLGFGSYYDWLRSEYEMKRNRLTSALKDAGIRPVTGQGGLFVMGDVSGIEVPEKYMQRSTPACPVMTKDWAFCLWIAEEFNLIAIPTSAFFNDREAGLAGKYVRFCFAKNSETLEMAEEALARLRDALKSRTPP